MAVHKCIPGERSVQVLAPLVSQEARSEVLGYQFNFSHCMKDVKPARKAASYVDMFYAIFGIALMRSAMPYKRYQFRVLMLVCLSYSSL